MSGSTPLELFCNWLCRLWWLNTAFLVLTLSGGLLFGLCPATVTVCLMLRRYLNGQHSVSAGQLWQVYRAEFVRANALGLTLLVPAFAAFWYCALAQHTKDTLLATASLALLPLGVFLALWCYSALVGQSIYAAGSLGAALKNGLILLGQGRVLVLTLICTLTVALTESALPLLALFVGLTPVLFTTVGLLWYTHPELKVQPL
ncbi:MAG: DUF624 domain-containing protein [Succinivibrio sp.]|nr:DUF624 domain-containing protein [Succinivibrio sp.]